MNYEKLIETISEIVNNEKINKVGLTLTYDLKEPEHNLINKEIFYKLNPPYTEFVPLDVFELEINGILIRFNKK